MAVITQVKFHFNQLMVTLIFGIWASESSPPPARAWQTTEKVGPDMVNEVILSESIVFDHMLSELTACREMHQNPFRLHAK